MKWSEDELREEANKFNSLKDWREQSYASYQAAYKRDLHLELSKHMIRLVRYPYTKSEIIELVKECKTKSNFHKKYPRAYAVAKTKRFYSELPFEKPVKVTKKCTCLMCPYHKS